MPDANGHYTFQEFHQKTGKGQPEYVKYTRYVTNMPKRRAAARAAAAANPLAPQPYPVMQQQATQQAQAAYGPAISAEQKNYAQQQGLLSRALTGYTGALAKALPSGDAAYQLARQQAGDVAASSAALGQSSVQNAQGGQAAMADYLRSIGAPDASQHFATDIGSRGNFTAANLAATAQAGQEGMLGRGGSLAQYLSGLPRIAAIGGKRSLASGLTNLGMKHTSALGTLLSQRGAAVSSLLTNAQNRNLSGAVANIGLDKTALQQAGANQRADTAAKKVTYKIVASNKTYWRIGSDGSSVDTGVKVKPSSAGTKTGPYGLPQTQVNQAQRRAGAITTADAKPIKTKVWVPGPAYNTAANKALRATGIGTDVHAGMDQVTKVTQPHTKNYDQALREVVAAITPFLPGWPQADIIRFAQKQVNPVYGR